MKLPSRLVTAFFAAALLPSMAVALPQSYSQGVQAYNAHQFKQALGYFSDAERTAPSSPEVHYYLGLCYQSMNQMATARQQYEWVAHQTANPMLRGQAGAALQQLSRYAASAQSQAPQEQAPAKAVVAAGPKLNGRLQVMEFYADW
jgi:thioredoxin-like negative regulator of GroEL